MWIAGVDGCRAGWIAFKVSLPNLSTTPELLNLPSLLKNKPDNLACLAIDIPIGLLDCSRACDKEARKLLRQPRGTSVFAAPCRASLTEENHTDASAANRRITGRGLSQQAWGIAPKIKQVDDAITAGCQQRVFEVHPEVSFWALNGRTPMQHNKKFSTGRGGTDLHCYGRFFLT
jgi:predicted RNase H-like nuclease